VSLAAIAERHRQTLQLGFVPRSLPECLAPTQQGQYPIANEMVFSAVEPDLNTIAASILSKTGMKWLMYIADEVSDEPKSRALLIPWRIGSLKHLGIPGNRLNDAVPKFAIALLVVVVGVPGKVDEVIRIHVYDLTTYFVGPFRCGS
jgi:hypothetical protein